METSLATGAFFCQQFSGYWKSAGQKDFLCSEKTRIKLVSIVFYNRACKRRKAIVPGG